MPIYEFYCRNCSNISEIYTRQYIVPSQPPCETCGSRQTEKLVSLSNYKVAIRHKYSEDFVEKSLPFLKSRKELKGVFESDPKESDESKAMKVSDQIGEQIDRVIDKQISKMRK